jgi:threonyl-tRNA synthetase
VLGAHAETKSWEDIVKEKKSYYDQRVAMFEQIKAKYDAALATAREQGDHISVTMPDGSVREGVKGVTTPMDVALGISKGLAKKSVVARVDGGVWYVEARL